jgi:hypothetical protein
MNVGIYVCVNEVIILEDMKNHINGIQVLRKDELFQVSRWGTW